VEAADALTQQPKRSVGRRLAGLFHGRPRLQAGSLLAGPVGWLVIGYLGSLAVLLIAGFWTLGELSGEVERTFTLENFEQLVSEPVYREIAGRTVLIAALVTITDIVLALPLAFFMAKVAGPRARGMLVVAVLVPLWSAYLVKVYAWRTILSEEGALNWALDPLGMSGPGYGNVAVWLVMSYIWLPYMIIPIYAALERMPDSVLAASEDLGQSRFTRSAAWSCRFSSRRSSPAPYSRSP
jgi:putative spermidine/putrescine transport system permease protein